MDALKFTIIYIILILIPSYFSSSGLFETFVWIGGVLAALEGKSYLKYKKTVSQRFWDESKKNRVIGVCGVSAFCLYLIAHLIFEI